MIKIRDTKLMKKIQFLMIYLNDLFLHAKELFSSQNNAIFRHERCQGRLRKADYHFDRIKSYFD